MDATAVSSAHPGSVPDCAALAISPERLNILNGLFESIAGVADNVYVYATDLRTDVTRWSPGAVDNFSLPGRYMKGAAEHWEKLLHPEDRAVYREELQSIYQHATPRIEISYRIKNSGGQYVRCVGKGTVINDLEGRPEYLSGIVVNCELQNYLDITTGLRNQYGFFEDLERELQHRTPCHVLLFGFGQFADINDIYGFDFGNRLLRTLGGLAKRRFDTCIYRADGPKFALIARHSSEEAVAAGYRELQDQMRAGLDIGGKKVTAVLRGGLVTVDCFDITSRTVYSCLNYAYSESKHNHQGDLVQFDREINHDNDRYLKQLNAIRQSITDDCRGFYLCYQAIVDSRSEDLIGAEALLRWRNDDYGIVPPNDFIPVLEQDSLFPRLGNWILSESLKDGRQFLEKYPNFKLHVNLSYAQLDKTDFVHDLLGLLKKYHFPANNLCLEITERCRLLNMNRLTEIISALHQRRVRFALDDFGTGYASIAILRQLPMDTVKIDRSFVTNIEFSEKDQDVIKYITQLINVYEAEVCVEGVETPNMRDRLRKYAVTSLQGYYYSRPIEFAEFQDRYLTA